VVSQLFLHSRFNRGSASHPDSAAHANLEHKDNSWNGNSYARLLLVDHHPQVAVATTRRKKLQGIISDYSFHFLIYL